jgi:heat shock protein HslJ
MKKQFLSFFTLLVLAGIILSACSGATSAPLTGTWKLVSYGSSASLTPTADVDTSIIFDEDGRISGNVGCNDSGGEYKVDGDKITFESISSTLMMCADTAIGDQETAVLSTLTETVTFVVDGNTLTLRSADGDSVIVLAWK